ncbi:MAG: hypothetical protein GX457_14250 [Thermotogaceae bacterium]|nr:hypothetical protein [Thermotogaceae bacterium]
MPKLKRLLVSACFETAQRRRRCSRNQEHVICQGDKCLVIKENMSKNNYCMECAALILQKAREELDGLSHELRAGETSAPVES